MSLNDQDSHWKEIEGDSTYFDVDLEEPGDEQSGLHTRNDPESPYQRMNVIQRDTPGALRVRCTCLDIVHGQWGSSSPGARATLVVLLFRWDPLQKASRVLAAHIDFRFFDSQGRHRNNPEVVDISLNRSCTLNPTKEIKQHKRGLKGGIALGAEGVTIPGISISTYATFEKSFEREKNGYTYVVGHIGRFDATFGPDNAASWSLEENRAQETGIPAAMRVGILLKRSTDDEFYCTVSLRTKADLKTRIKELVGRKDVDDPILFDPSAPPTNKLQEYDLQNLGNFDVASVEDIAIPGL